jgi:fatty-acyl-CoA synthase
VIIRSAIYSDKVKAETERAIAERWSARTLHEQLCQTADRYPDRPAITFQLTSGPADPASSRTWEEFRDDVTRAANLFRKLGIGPEDVMAYVLPNGLEAPTVLLAGATAGIVNPVNPLLSVEHIAAILRETRAKVVVTLAPFPKTDLPQNVAKAIALAPGVRLVLEVDLARYLPFPKALVARAIRPRFRRRHTAQVVDFHAALASQSGAALEFTERRDNSVCAYFHTGGTTGLPKIAQHRPHGILYNGWCGAAYMFTEEDVLMCPLPLFHVLAAYPIFMSCLMTGAQMVLPTPQGYRGAGVLDTFWKLVERHRVSFVVMVPTAAAALMQRPVDADISTLRQAISGSAAMPVELFHRFESATGITILEGYGMTEATCLVSINPPFGERRIGSVGFPFPYTDVKIRDCAPDGAIRKDLDRDEVGEICVKGPGVSDAIYTEVEKNRGALTPDGYLRTCDLGRIDADGYIWITGRAKDLIIRGGHNIDPAMIEDAFMHHPDVAFAGAIGQPDAHAGEVPAVYLELVEGARSPVEAIEADAIPRICERAALPRHVEVLEALPKTAVGKVFKPELRRLAMVRVLGEALEVANTGARIDRVIDDRRRGQMALVTRSGRPEGDEAARQVLGGFAIPWEWSDTAASNREHSMS